jgi:hypothetical protein
MLQDVAARRAALVTALREDLDRRRRAAERLAAARASARRRAAVGLATWGALTALVLLALAGDIGADDCLADGATRGGWQVRYAGHGCARIAAGDGAGDARVVLTPRAAASRGATHGSLALGPRLSSLAAPARFRIRVHTARQLRTGSAPNPWEVAWVVWHYADDAHFYYFIPKPTGWELGKRDPAYPGGQRFLATGADRRFPVGAWYDVEVAQRGRTITVAVDGVPVVSAVDGERAYTRGHVGVYAEDASVTARDVALPPP